MQRYLLPIAVYPSHGKAPHSDRFPSPCWRRGRHWRADNNEPHWPFTPGRSWLKNCEGNEKLRIPVQQASTGRHGPLPHPLQHRKTSSSTCIDYCCTRPPAPTPATCRHMHDEAGEGGMEGGGMHACQSVSSIHACSEYGCVTMYVDARALWCTAGNNMRMSRMQQQRAQASTHARTNAYHLDEVVSPINFRHL